MIAVTKGTNVAINRLLRLILVASKSSEYFNTVGREHASIRRRIIPMENPTYFQLQRIFVNCFKASLKHLLLF